MTAIDLMILLPHKLFLHETAVSRVVVNTEAGSYGFLPARLDCVTALQSGLVIYESSGEEHYVAIDQGILVKMGDRISIAVRNAISGTSLGELHLKVKDVFRNIDEEERQVRNVMANLESGFIKNFEQLTRG